MSDNDTIQSAIDEIEAFVKPLDTAGFWQLHAESFGLSKMRMCYRALVKFAGITLYEAVGDTPLEAITGLRDAITSKVTK